jgi:phosphoribosylamine--glycine ligase
VNLLIVGGGGREHALAWRLARDSPDHVILAAPGNPGIAEHARCVPIGVEDGDSIERLAVEERVDLVVIGPEAPLVAGLADRLAAAGVVVCGPRAAAARLEGSKAFAKRFMLEHGIPTAEAAVFDVPEQAAAFARWRGAPLVVKADGLAGGKGVVVARTVGEALAAIDRLMRERTLGAAGRRVLIERCMEGEEASLIVLTDGERWVLLPPAQDHKRLGEGDTGPNTGGMGAYAPAPVLDPPLIERALREIVEPTLAGLRDLGTPYMGFLYCGLMIEDGEPRVVEYNCRLGDPEAQVVLPLVGGGEGSGDFAELLAAAARGELTGRTLPVAPDTAAACVVLAAPGYPEAPVTGAPIRGLPVQAGSEVIVFHAGTRYVGERLVTAGGRVLGVTGLGRDLPQALARAYRAADQIEFEGKQMRRDIGQRALARRS